MKIIIISDINGNSESIIPYGLHLAKRMESEADIIHITDPRVIQGVPSAYADSQSVAAGDKLTHPEIIQREKDSARKKLDFLLSREASVLNYPLKINVIVEEGRIENKMDEIIGGNPLTLFVMNQEADNQMFLSEDEMVDICKLYKGIYLFVPPGFKFQEFFRVVLPADFSNHDLEEYERGSAFINLFQPNLMAIGKAGNREESEVKMWIEQVEKIFFKALVNNYLLDANRDFDEDFMYYVEVNEPDLIMIIEKHLGIIQSIFKKELVIKLLKLKKTPILFLYSPK